MFARYRFTAMPGARTRRRVSVFRCQFCGRRGDDAVATGTDDAFCGARGRYAALRIAAGTGECFGVYTGMAYRKYHRNLSINVSRARPDSPPERTLDFN